MKNIDEILSSLANKKYTLFSLNEKKALVIGGSKGLGQAMALVLASAGADVCVVGRGPDGLAETADAIVSFKRKALYYATDVTKEANVIDLMKYVDDNFGRLDVLVNSQGAVYLNDTIDFEEKEWQKVIDVNLKSGVRQFCAKMAKQHFFEPSNLHRDD